MTYEVPSISFRTATRGAAACGLALFASTGAALAAEGGIGFYLLGSKGPFAGVLPAPGTYINNDLYYYTGSASAGRLWSAYSLARLMTAMATSRCSGPSASSWKDSLRMWRIWPPIRRSPRPSVTLWLTVWIGETPSPGWSPPRERHPGLRMVIDHLAKPPIGLADREPWWSLIAAAAENPNVSGKLSGLYSATGAPDAWTTEQVRPFFDRAVELFGPSRLMYGGDWPVAILAGGYTRLWEGLAPLLDSLSSEDRERVLGRTAADFYRIDPARLDR